MARFNKRHGMTGTKEYDCWVGMRQRCNNPRCPQFKDYGGRGIKVCGQWNAPDSFMIFFAAIGFAPFPKAQIDRIDNNRGYEPGNVHWTTAQANVRNSRRFITFEYNGKIDSIDGHCYRLKVPSSLIKNRMYIMGKTFVEALAMGSARCSHGPVTFVDFEGERISTGKLAKRYNLHRDTVAMRIKRGWTPQAAVADGHLTPAPFVITPALAAIHDAMTANVHIAHNKEL